MIKVSIPKSSSVRPPASNVKGVFRGLFNKIFSTLKLKPFKLNQRGVTEAQASLDRAEEHIRRASVATVQMILEDLQDDTPVDTGATRDAWALKIDQKSNDTTYTITHPDPKLIHLLNAGSRPHMIHPANKKALKFMVGGVTIFARSVRHPGTKRTGFVDRARNKLDRTLRALRT